MDLVTLARIGTDAEDFLHSPLGRYIQSRAKDEIDEALDELIEAAPDDLTTNTQARRRIHRAQDAITWLLEAVSDGKRARIELERPEE